jgi:hypothetical protein
LASLDRFRVNVPIRKQILDLSDNFLCRKRPNEVVTSPTESTANRAAALGGTANHRAFLIGWVLVQHGLRNCVAKVENVFTDVLVG